MRLISPSSVLILVCTTIINFSQALEVGDPAPDFSLLATDGITYRLSELSQEGVVVLAWFPRAFTQGCTLECKSLAENGHLLRQYQVNYFMVSVDPLEENMRFAQATQADFPLLSDPDMSTARAYGVFNENRGVANRVTFYIGTDGRILAIDRAVRPATSAEDMAAKLGQLGVPKS